MRRIGEVVPVYRAMEQQLTASGSDRTAAVRRRNLTFLATERLLPQGAPIILALAANARFPPFTSKCAWCSNRAASPSHHCRERPRADVQDLLKMLRCSPSLLPFAQSAAF
jgi:hypothetical protein